MASKLSPVKVHRNHVYGKYGGRCAFCGDQLPPRWHVWPIVKDGGRLRIVDARGVPKDARELDLPACISCNRTRLNNSMRGGVLITIEQFRGCLYREFKFLRSQCLNAPYYQKALRFGLIQETNKPIVFFFERV
jgi:hypothetical protein